MEMGSISDGSRHHGIAITCVHQQILDVTFQILCNHGNCKVSVVTFRVPNLDLINNGILELGIMLKATNDRNSVEERSTHALFTFKATSHHVWFRCIHVARLPSTSSE